eukprot:2008035-Heterocapsa_arctica.AAC.1
MVCGSKPPTPLGGWVILAALTLPSPPPGAPAPALTVRKWAPAMEHQSNPGETCSWALQDDPVRAGRHGRAL